MVNTLITGACPLNSAMKRFLVLLAVAALGFLIASAAYALVEPYLPMLPYLALVALDIITSGWFIAGVIGAILALYLLVRWARSGEW